VEAAPYPSAVRNLTLGRLDDLIIVFGLTVSSKFGMGTDDANPLNASDIPGSEVENCLLQPTNDADFWF
jgi:hypothetical protein